MIINATVQGYEIAPKNAFVPRAIVNGKLTYSNNNPFIPLSNEVKDVDQYIFYYAYQNTPAEILNGNIDLGSLERISGSNAMQRICYNCPGITSVDFSSLKTVTGQSCLRYGFYNDTGITSVNLSSLETVTGTSAFSDTFSNCTGITSIDLGNLTTVTSAQGFQNCFSGCSGLTNINLSSLKTLTGNNCIGGLLGGTSVSDLRFPALNSSSFGTNKTSLNNLLFYILVNCTIHFPKNLDPQTGSTVISSMNTYPNFGGANTVLMFDLPSTNILTGVDSVQYERNPKYDTATALSWRVNDSSVTTTPYYTNTTNDPVVGDTIYSDSACTIAFTTISSIA